MRKKRVITWSLGLMGVGLLAWPTGASAQTRIFSDAETLATGRSQTVVVTQRPLRTFRGQAVRVGRFSDDRQSIGVVRRLRKVPSVFGDHHDVGFDGFSSFGSSSFGFFPRVEESIGVVRPFRTFQPVVRNKPQTFTNPYAVQTPVAADADSAPTPAPLRPVLSDGADEDIEVTAVADVELPEAHQDDPWALLDQGYYREARLRFATLGNLGDTEMRTGHALSAILAGDLRGGVALMPDDPALPEGVALGAPTMKRLQQVSRYLYADDTAMQSKLQALIDAEASAAVASAD